MKHDYSLRGKCKELSEQLAKENPGLTVVCGWYHCLIWGKQEHWWCVDEDGKVHDPTAAQFPSLGGGCYELFQGLLECAQCGREVALGDACGYGRYTFCDGDCLKRFVL